MIRNFFSTPNVIGRLMLILLFVSGVVYAGAFDGFVVEIEASSCCGGGTDAAIFSSSECCDDDGGGVCKYFVRMALGYKSCELMGKLVSFPKRR